MIKFVYAILIILVIAGFTVFSYFDFALVLSGGMAVLAVLAWLKNVNAQTTDKLEKNKPKESTEELFTGEEGEVYHNDFSKVPAGTADPMTPPPRSIGYGYGDGGRSTYEDLERIGIKTTDDKKE